MEAFTRLKQAIDFLRYMGVPCSHDDIARKLDRNRVNVTKAINGDSRYLTKPLLRSFAAAYSDYINEDWLLTGEGQMEKADASMRPHIGVKAYAGFMTGIGESDSGADLCERIPFIPEYDFTIAADGESMMPKIESGSILACRLADDRANPPIGKICVFDTKDGAAVKVLKSADGGRLTLHSLNPEYKDYAIVSADVNRIAVVVGMVSNLA